MTTRAIPERRQRDRVEIHARLQGQGTNGGIHPVSGVSKNLSAGGMFAFVESELAAGSYVEVVLDVPSHDLGKDVVRLRCVGRVVRHEDPTEDGLHGIGVEFDEVEVIRES